MTHASLPQARPDWNEAGMPVSGEFGDVYFSDDNGLHESRHVFLHHNGLPERWPAHDKPLFVIGETGFGTGLNFLAVWQAFRAHLAGNPVAGARRLHFVSFEKYPLEHADMARALAAWPELAPEAEQLLAQYPLPLPGCHRLLLGEGRVSLDLWFGDIHDTLGELWQPAGGLMDAWFLDGFAPSKNPDMWTQPLFEGLARLARPGSTLATFTAAGFVRRGLNAAGFHMQRVKGYGRKWEMLAGRREGPPLPPPGPACYQRAPALATGRITAILGGGIASASLALALVRRGQPVQLFCADAQPAGGASGNRQGAIYPLLNGEHDPLSRFYAAAFGFARRTLDQLANHRSFAHAWCGVLQLGHDDKSCRKLHKLLAGGFPAELVRPLDDEARDRTAGLPLSGEALLYPQGGWVNPAELTQALLDEAQASGLLELRLNSPIRQLISQDDGWCLEEQTGRQHEVGNLIIATGHACTAFAPLAALPLTPVRGQVSHLDSCPPLTKLRTVLCYEGYLTPVHEGLHCLGASYGRNQRDLALREEEHADNHAKLLRSLPDRDWPMTLAPHAGRVGIRAAVRDHLPLMGEVPDVVALETSLAGTPPGELAHRPTPVWPGLYVLGGLGSRGLCSAPLLGESLASQLCGEPLPLDVSLLQALAPQRFWLRPALRRRGP